MLYGINIVMRLPMRAKFLNVASDNFKGRIFPIALWKMVNL